MTIFLNMYVALTNPFYANPGIKDWLGIGNLVRSEPIIAVIALVNGIAFAWTLAQLRPRARDRLEDELAEASTEDGGRHLAIVADPGRRGRVRRGRRHSTPDRRRQ